MSLPWEVKRLHCCWYSHSHTESYLFFLFLNLLINVENIPWAIPKYVILTELLSYEHNDQILNAALARWHIFATSFKLFTLFTFINPLLRFSFFHRFIKRFVLLCCFFICRTDTRVKYSFVLCFTFRFIYRFIIVSFIVSYIVLTIYMYEHIVYIVDTELHCSLASL